jgi:hypothetical protein
MPQGGSNGVCSNAVLENSNANKEVNIVAAGRRQSTTEDRGYLPARIDGLKYCGPLPAVASSHMAYVDDGSWGLEGV